MSSSRCVSLPSLPPSLLLSLHDLLNYPSLLPSLPQTGHLAVTDASFMYTHFLSSFVSSMPSISPSLLPPSLPPSLPSSDGPLGRDRCLLHVHPLFCLRIPLCLRDGLQGLPRPQRVGGPLRGSGTSTPPSLPPSLPSSFPTRTLILLPSLPPSLPFLRPKAPSLSPRKTHTHPHTYSPPLPPSLPFLRPKAPSWTLPRSAPTRPP